LLNCYEVFVFSQLTERQSAYTALQSIAVIQQSSPSEFSLKHLTHDNLYKTCRLQATAVGQYITMDGQLSPLVMVHGLRLSYN